MTGAARSTPSFDQLNNLGRLNYLLTSSDHSPIYAVNNTEPRGMIVLTIADPTSGKSKKLEFPKTWLPFNLADLLPRSALDYCMELKETLKKNNLKIISEQEATVLLESERGRKEYDRLYKSEFSVGGVGNRKQELMVATEITKSQTNPLQQLNDQSPSRDRLVLHPKMQAWEQRVTAGEMNGDALVSELLNHGHEFTRTDCEYILTNNFPFEAKDYAQELLQKNQLAASPLNLSKPTDKKSDYVADWE